jgi:hypothetical protein
VADLGAEPQFRGWLANGPESAPGDSPQMFLAFCGVVGMGAVLARREEASLTEPVVGKGFSTATRPVVVVPSPGAASPLQVLRYFAADPRWRIREGVAMALQRWGDINMRALLDAMTSWSRGTPLEQRAAAAALCEPRLLGVPGQAAEVLQILDAITSSLLCIEDRKTDDVQALRKGLGYCWSVATAACPEAGKKLMERWFASTDRDILWIMKENLRKNRLARMDATWVNHWRASLGVS